MRDPRIGLVDAYHSPPYLNYDCPQSCLDLLNYSRKMKKENDFRTDERMWKSLKPSAFSVMTFRYVEIVCYVGVFNALRRFVGLHSSYSGSNIFQIRRAIR